MTKIVVSKHFARESKKLYKKYQSLVHEVVGLIQSLENNPIQGTPIGKHCYKIRLKITSKNVGKSGGARVITYFQVEGNTIILLSIYDKSEQSNISDSEILKRLQDLL